MNEIEEKAHAISNILGGVYYAARTKRDGWRKLSTDKTVMGSTRSAAKVMAEELDYIVSIIEKGVK